MDLFGVFTEQPSQVSEDKTQQNNQNEAQIAPKRKQPVETKFVTEPTESDETTSNKKAKTEKAKVADNVEVEAASADPDGSQKKLTHTVRHEVALPPDYDYTPIADHKSENPARIYPFTLDPFQAMSVAAIERQESVLVSAHTSAGKTVVAEYAIAQSLRSKQRVIYTSPIKALSNQKYRELLAEFKDVGLMTGDVTINPDASCLVMTTEILRSMLYRGSEVMREVQWVIFDEIHYMRDKERGVVWEETIILLPDSVRYVFLSATIPNALEFAEWICKIHCQPCHVVYTNFRPTPLQHYLFPEGSKGIHLVMDEAGNFREENFQKAMGTLGEAAGEDPAQAVVKSKKGQTAKGGNKNGMSDIYMIIKMIMMKNYNPVIVFSFSKRECEQLALKLQKLDFNNSDEHDMVEKVFENAISQLSPADQELQQIKSIAPLLRKGIGVHHSGLLPILKEVIEILFQEGLIKVLFATETFSIGLNMPAKTVVFTSVRKWDGKEMRWVSGGEYIQMSGRAGRRGLDDRGIVIMMINEAMEPAVAKGMVKGVADRLDSAFHLGYNMILNLLRVEGISPEFMLERCFYQYQNAAKVPQLEVEQRQIEAEIAATQIDQIDAVSEFYNLKEKIAEYGRDIAKVVSHPGNSLKFLVPGRLVEVVVRKSQDDGSNAVEPEVLNFGWGVVTSLDKRPKPRHATTDFKDHEKYIVEVLLSVSPTTPAHLVRKGDPNLVPGVRPPNLAADEQPKAEILPVTLDSIVAIANIRTPLPTDLAAAVQRRTVLQRLVQINKKFPDGVPRLDPIASMHIKDKDFTDLLRKTEVLESKLATNALIDSPELPELYEKYSGKVALQKKKELVGKRIREAQAILQMEELKNRKRVLRKLGFASDDDIVELKGRVACEISSGDELLLTELIFNGTFTPLEPDQCAALLSCFVFDEKVNDQNQVVNPALKEPLRALQTMASRIAKVSTECKMPLVEEDYVASFRPQLMDVVYQWCKGATFAQICKMTDVFEGSLIRMFRRLEELLRQLSVAATTIGNTELAAKMDKALDLIKRDLVSAASLYL